MKKKNKAFTLMELMVAVLILALMATGLLMTYVSSLLLGQTSVNLVKASNISQFVLEDLKSISYNNIENYQPPLFEKLKDEVIEIEVNDTGGGTKKVVVDISWQERNQARNFKLFTIFYE